MVYAEQCSPGVAVQQISEKLLVEHCQTFGSYHVVIIFIIMAYYNNADGITATGLL